MLNFSLSSGESDLRLAIVECGRIAYEHHLMTSSSGNISVRMDDGLILITPARFSKGRLSTDDLVVIDIDGNLISAKAGHNPSSEAPMHLEVYKHREDVRAVIHAHPIFATTLTVAGLEFPADVLPEVLLTLGKVPVTTYAMPSSPEDAIVIRPFVKDHNALLLRQHGSLTYGKNLDEALIHLENIEHAAEVYWHAKMLGTVMTVPPDAKEQIVALREQMLKT